MGLKVVRIPSGDGDLDNITLLIACLALGVALRKSRRVPEDGHVTLNAFVLNVSLPALTLLQVHSAPLQQSFLPAALMPWASFVFSVVLFWFIGRALGLPRTTIGALTIACGLGNTSFIGLPMIEAFYGASGMWIGLVIGQLGTYLVLSTVGILVICLYSEASVSRWEIARRIGTFPPLLALVAAFALRSWIYPVWVESALGHLGETLTPLALVSVGLQLRPRLLRGNGFAVALGLGYKLVLAPVLIALVYVGMLDLHGLTVRITVFEAAMPPQIGSAIVAMQYGLAPELITLLVGSGTVLCFFTLPVVSYLLRAV